MTMRSVHRIHAGEQGQVAPSMRAWPNDHAEDVTVDAVYTFFSLQ